MGKKIKGRKPYKDRGRIKVQRSIALYKEQWDALDALGNGKASETIRLILAENGFPIKEQPNSQSKKY